MALPVRLDGLGITNPCADTPSHYDTSLKITAPLTALIMEQSNQYPNTIKTEQIRVKKEEVLFVTLVASDMAGIHQICLFSVLVTNSSLYQDPF